MFHLFCNPSVYSSRSNDSLTPNLPKNFRHSHPNLQIPSNSEKFEKLFEQVKSSSKDQHNKTNSDDNADHDSSSRPSSTTTALRVNCTRKTFLK